MIFLPIPPPFPNFLSLSLAGNPAMQATLGSQVLFFAMFLHMIYRPFVEDVLDNVETFSLASSVIALTCGNLLLNDSTPPIWKVIATVTIFVTMLLFALYVLYHLFFAVKHKIVKAASWWDSKKTHRYSALPLAPIPKRLVDLCYLEQWDHVLETHKYSLSRRGIGGGLLGIGGGFWSWLGGGDKAKTNYSSAKIEFAVPMSLSKLWQRYLADEDTTFLPLTDPSHSTEDDPPNCVREYNYCAVETKVPFVTPRLLVLEKWNVLHDKIAVIASATTEKVKPLAGLPEAMLCSALLSSAPLFPAPLFSAPLFPAVLCFALLCLEQVEVNAMPYASLDVSHNCWIGHSLDFSHNSIRSRFRIITFSVSHYNSLGFLSFGFSYYTLSRFRIVFCIFFRPSPCCPPARERDAFWRTFALVATCSKSSVRTRPR